jgi:hypothetical protein
LADAQNEDFVAVQVKTHWREKILRPCLPLLCPLV